MTSVKNPEATPTKVGCKCWIVLGLAGLLLFSALASLLVVGRWLVVEDPLKKAQAIVVLSGGMPLRALEAGRLYREGYGPKVWLTRTTEPGARLEAMHIPYVGEESYDLRVLVRQGVPADAVRVLEPPILNTADELAAVSAALEQEQGGTVIIVTSKVHTRRARILWHRLPNPRGQAVIRAASDDPFEPGRWWRTSRDALDVVRELLGILNAWAGMPLRPAN
jgi:uncharacterized SAM-binding protein YcdF (DUF218 family)